MFIIIRGPLGVGKTTIAQELAKKLKAHVISIDKILTDNALDQAGDDGILVQNFLKGNEIVLPEIKNTLKKGTPVIIDGCFYHKEQIEHFLNDLPEGGHVITLIASVEICIERDRQREKPYGEDAARAVHWMVSKFDYGTVINTEDQTPKETAQAILSLLTF